MDVKCRLKRPSFYCLIHFYKREVKMPLAKDLLHPLHHEEKRKHKLKRLVQHPNSYFMDVKCSGCYRITTVFSHAQTVVVCAGCSTVLCQPTEAVQGLLRAAASEGSSTKEHATGLGRLLKNQVSRVL